MLGTPCVLASQGEWQTSQINDNKGMDTSLLSFVEAGSPAPKANMSGGPPHPPGRTWWVPPTGPKPGTGSAAVRRALCTVTSGSAAGPAWTTRGKILPPATERLRAGQERRVDPPPQ